MFQVEEQSGHPGFYCIIDRKTNWQGDTWNLYLHKDESIQTFVGFMIQTPDEMGGLWNNEEDAKQFLVEWRAKQHIPR